MANSVSNGDEITLDCEELTRLQSLTTRESVKSLLSRQIQDLEKQRDQKQQNITEKGDGATTTETVVPTPTETKKVLVSRLTTKTITSYGWDQSPKFVKLYITLNGVHTLAKGDVTVDYTARSFSLKVNNLKGCNHQLVMTSLLHTVNTEKSYHKVKTDNIVILLKKEEETNWSYLTQTEQKTKDKKPPPKMDNPEDPTAGIMGMMKKMYDEGDDEIKRSIAKAWTEARDKKDTLGFP